MPSDLLVREFKTPNSGVEQLRDYGSRSWTPASGEIYPRRLPPHRAWIVLAAPAQSPTDSESGRRIEEYVEGYLSRNLELASATSSPAGVSISPLARAALMSPWDAKNRRRIRLIEKKYELGLNGQEAAELAKLKDEVAARMEVVAPRTGDVLDEQAARLERLKRKKAQARIGKLG